MEFIYSKLFYTYNGSIELKKTPHFYNISFISLLPESNDSSL